jgi:hypothetical protein
MESWLKVSCGCCGTNFSSFRRIRSDRSPEFVGNITSNSDELRFVGVVSLRRKVIVWEQKNIRVALGASAGKMLNEYKARIDAEE